MTTAERIPIKPQRPARAYLIRLLKDAVDWLSRPGAGAEEGKLAAKIEAALEREERADEASFLRKERRYRRELKDEYAKQAARQAAAANEEDSD